MMTGVFPEQPPLGFDPQFQLLEPTPSTTANHGLSDDGRRILYSTNVPAPWLDTVNTSPAITDDIDPLIGQGWSVDGFVVEGARAGSAAALEASGRTLTVTTYDDAGSPRALGSYENPARGSRAAAAEAPASVSRIVCTESQAQAGRDGT